MEINRQNIRELPSQYLYMVKALYILIVGIILYLGFSHWAYDDPFITYRYADNLEHGLGFVYNSGERVLSTTTPLFTLLLAILGFVWSNLPHLANLIGGICLPLGAVFLWDLANTFESPWVGWAGLLLYPIFPLLVTTLGSETPLYLAFCLGAFSFYARRRYYLTAVFTAMALLTRPDAALVAIILGIDYLVRFITQRLFNQRNKTESKFTSKENSSLLKSNNQQFPWLVLVLFFVLVLPWNIFAWIYFGSPFPVTLFAKQSQALMVGSQHFAEGFLTIVKFYLTRWYYLVEMALAMFGIVLVVRKARRWMLVLSWTVIYFLSYSILGVSRYYWYYAPLVPGFVILVGLGLGTIDSGFNARREGQDGKSEWPIRRYGAMGLGILLIVLVTFQVSDLWQIRKNPDSRFGIYQAVGLWLHSNTDPKDTVGALEVGIIGYFAKNKMVDFAGLIQPEIAAQLSRLSTYEDVAVWAVENYKPDYLVIHDGIFPRLMTDYVTKDCTLAQHYLGEQYGYASDMSIFACR